MPGRTLALAGALGVIGLLAFLTVSVIVQHGVDVLSAISILILAVLGFGVLGALRQPPDE